MQGGIMEKAVIKVIKEKEQERFSTLPAFGSTRTPTSAFDRPANNDHTHFENVDRKILKAGSGIGGGNYVKPIKGNSTFHGRLVDKVNNQEVNL